MLTEDRNEPLLKETGADGQQKAYLVLSAEERAKGFIRPLRQVYIHVGEKPKNPLHDLTPEQNERYGEHGYVKYEAYPASESSATGRYWTAEDLKGGCGVETRMGLPLCETYARNPGFYGATFCCGCRKHLPVAQFVWKEDGAVVGS